MVYEEEVVAGGGVGAVAGAGIKIQDMHTNISNKLVSRESYLIKDFNLAAI